MISIPIVSNFDSKGIKSAIREFKQLETVGQKAQFAIKKAAVPAAAALGAVVAVIGDSVKAAIEDEAAQASLARQLKSSIGASKQQIKEVENYITKTSMASAVTDDKLRPALAGLLRNTNNLTRAQELANIALDVAAATGKDYEAVALALGKAETGNYSALKKLGIPLGENAVALQEQAKFTKALLKAQADYQNQVELFGPTSKEAAKALEKVQKAQEAVNAVTVEGADFTDDLIKQFGGANKAFTETAAGGLQKLSIAFGETKESIGAAFLPILLKLQPALDKFASWAQENPDLLAAVIAGMGILAVSILAVNAAMMLNPAVAITAGIIALGVAIVAAYKKFEGFREVVRTVVNFVAAYVEGMANAFIKAINVVIYGINLLKPGKDIKALQEIKIGRMSEPLAVEPADLGTNGSANIAERNNNVSINVYGGDPNQVVAALRTYMRTNGAVPIRISDAF
jgi:uncharacterized membrane protein YjjP (DUF1212 family)